MLGIFVVVNEKVSYNDLLFIKCCNLEVWCMWYFFCCYIVGCSVFKKVYKGLDNCLNVFGVIGLYNLLWCWLFKVISVYFKKLMFR